MLPHAIRLELPLASVGGNQFENRGNIFPPQTNNARRQLAGGPITIFALQSCSRLSGLRKRPAVRKSDGMTKSSMLLPRFTIRTLLAILTASAVVFVMVGTAFRGQYWAWGVTIGIISCIITALTHSAWFAIVWFFARVPEMRTGSSAVTPAALLMPVDTSNSANERSGPIDDHRPSAH
jgi:hypothetical protein